MDPDTPVSWYVSRRVDAPVDAVAAVLDRMLGGHAAAPVGPASDGEVADRLLLIPGGVAHAPVPGAPRRRVPGRLRTPRGIRPIRVELELTAWSRRTSELGLRPTRRVPPPRRTDAWFSAAAASLDGLSGRLTDALPVRAADRLERAS